MIRVIPKILIVSFLIASISLLPNNSTAKPLQELTEQVLEKLLKEQDIRCLAKNIYYESRGEPKEGKVAVGVVTLNRASNPRYPDNICDVVYQRTKNRQGKIVCQFSWTCMRLAKPKDTDRLWKSSLQTASRLLSGHYHHWEQKYSKAHHFHSTSVNPNWRLKRVSRIGRHIFYH